MMARRVTTRRMPTGGTTIHIPAQRGLRSRRQAPQVLVVMPNRRPSVLGRAAAATARGAWQRRRTFAPVWAAVALLIATGLAHALAPWLAVVLGVLAVLGPGAGFWLQQRRPADREATWWRWGAAATAFLVFGWLAAAAALGPLTDGLFFAWLALTAAAQAAWSRLYRPAATRPAREGA